MENYLARCIASVVGQSYGNLDIILIDDGSTEGSADICAEWARRDKRITYIRQDNAGLGAARNSGMRAAKSEYITFLDADDWFEPAFVEKIIGAMLNTGGDIGMCDIYYVDSASMSRQAVRLRFGKHVVSSRDDKSIVNKSRLFAWGKIYKRVLLDKCNFSFPDITFEDICIPLLVARADNICYVPEPLFSYFRNRPGSLSNDYNKIDDICKGLQLLYDKLNEFGMYKEYLLEYKKIMLGQLRFACRKWGALKNEAVTSALLRLEEFVGKTFLELANLTRKKYFAFGDQPLASALDKALPYAEQVVADISNADRVVAFDFDRPRIPRGTARQIIIPAVAQDAKDQVTLEFNIAELIMENLQ
jgi:glycosyltransferase involved in cell wall biosynthesis